MEIQKKKNSMTMLAYCKLILSKIEFDQGLLQKEYQKGIRYLGSDDIAELKRWLLINGKKIE